MPEQLTGRILMERLKTMGHEELLWLVKETVKLAVPHLESMPAPTEEKGSSLYSLVFLVQELSTRYAGYVQLEETAKALAEGLTDIAVAANTAATPPGKRS